MLSLSSLSDVSRKLNRYDISDSEMKMKLGYISRDASLSASAEMPTAETAVSEPSDSYFRTVVEGLLDAIYLFDVVRDSSGEIVDFVFTYLNRQAEQQTQMSRHEVIGKRISELFPFLYADGFFEQFKRAVETGEHFEQERVITQDNIDLGWYFHQVMPIGDSVAVKNRDITRRKQLEAQLIEKEREIARAHEASLNQLKTEMMQRIAHEFRTPLTRIGLASDILERYLERLTPEQVGERVHAIKTEIVRMEGMLSELNTAVIGLESEPFLGEGVDVCLLSQEITARFRRINSQPDRLTVTCGSIPRVRSSAHLLDLILVNLIANAIKFSSADASIHVDIRLDGDNIVFYVHDQGIGILPDDLPHIIEPFFRGHNFDEVPGLGVGLTLVNHAVNALNGQIDITSSPAQGTSVRVIIPAIWESES